MAGIGEMIRRASARRVLRKEDQAIRTLAPMMMEVVGPFGRQPPENMSPGRADPAGGRENAFSEAGGTRVPVPRNVGGHAVYRSLMRSHDRVATRHLGGGDNRARTDIPMRGGGDNRDQE